MQSIAQKLNSLTQKLNSMKLGPQRGPGSSAKARNPNRAAPPGPGASSGGRARRRRRNKKPPGDSTGIGTIRRRLGARKPTMSKVLKTMFRGPKLTTRCRLERFRFRATINLLRSNLNPNLRQPIIFFKPGASLVSTILVTGTTNATFNGGGFTLATLGTSTTTDTTAFANWVGAGISAVGGVPGADFPVNAGEGHTAEAMPAPALLLSTRVRPRGGIARLRIQCGPSIRGVMVARKLLAVDSTTVVNTLSAALDSEDGYVHRYELRPGVMTFDFYPAIENISLADTWVEASASLDCRVSLYGAWMISFRDVDYNTTSDLEPRVDYSTLTCVLTELPTSLGHFSNHVGTLTHAEHESNLHEIEEGGVVVTTGGIAGGVYAGEGIADVVETIIGVAATVM